MCNKFSLSNKNIQHNTVPPQTPDKSIDLKFKKMQSNCMNTETFYNVVVAVTSSSKTSVFSEDHTGQFKHHLEIAQKTQTFTFG